MPRVQRDISATFDDLKQEITAILYHRQELLRACKEAQQYFVAGLSDSALGILQQAIDLVEGENDSGN